MDECPGVFDGVISTFASSGQFECGAMPLQVSLQFCAFWSMQQRMAPPCMTSSLIHRIQQEVMRY
jgi:hypothetical protein